MAQKVRPRVPVLFEDRRSGRRDLTSIRLNRKYREWGADVAQMAEQLICNQRVVGSIPSVG